MAPKFEYENTIFCIPHRRNKLNSFFFAWTFCLFLSPSRSRPPILFFLFCNGSTNSRMHTLFFQFSQNWNKNWNYLSYKKKLLQTLLAIIEFYENFLYKYCFFFSGKHECKIEKTFVEQDYGENGINIPLVEQTGEQITLLKEFSKKVDQKFTNSKCCQRRS
jgi:hypothetical protein